LTSLARTGIACATAVDMSDVDRRKHDVDVIERVLGGVRDRLHDGAGSTQVVTLHNPDDGTVELTVGIADEGERRDTRGRSPSRGPS